jgi:hypothetical protein
MKVTPEMRTEFYNMTGWMADDATILSWFTTNKNSK